MESTDLDQMPYLSELVVSQGRLQPTFAREVTKYKLIIPHESPMVSISAVPAHCSCVAKFSTDHMTNLRQVYQIVFIVADIFLVQNARNI